MELKKKIALITGASRGIGAATAIKLAGEGCHIAINCHRSVELAKQVAKQCCGLGVKAIVVQGDVAIDDHCRRIVSESTHILGGLDILINNAGTTRFIDFQDLNNVTSLNSLSIQDKNEIWTPKLGFTNALGPFQVSVSLIYE